MERVCVRVAGWKRDSFVALPPSLCQYLCEVSGTKKFPIPLEIVELQPPCRRHKVAFAGQKAKGEGGMEVSKELAESLGLRERMWFRVQEADVPTASRAVVVPKTEGDYAAVSISSKAAEDGDVLNQVGLLTVGGSFPVWVDGTNKIAHFTVRSLEFSDGSTSSQGMIRSGTELVVMEPLETVSKRKEAKRTPVAGGGGASRRPTEARLLCLTRDILPILDLGEEAVLNSEGEAGEALVVWDITGFAAPDVVRDLGVGERDQANGKSPGGDEIESVLVKVVPKSLEGGNDAKGPRRHASLCLRLVAKAAVPEGHLALAPGLFLSLGVENLQRVLVLPVDCEQESAREAVSFSMEVSEVVDQKDQEAQVDESLEEEGGDEEKPFKLVADASTSERIVKSILKKFKDSTAENDQGDFLVLSKGMIVEACDDANGGRGLKLHINSVSASSPDDTLDDVGSLEHVAVRALSSVEMEISMGQRLSDLDCSGGLGFCTGTREGQKRDYLNSPWLVSARDSCVETLQMALDNDLSSKFLSRSIQFPGGVLVCGPSGSGKTVLCQSICDKFSSTKFLSKVVWLDCQDYMNMDLEKMKKDMRVSLSKAVECQPALVVFENIDIFASSLGDGQASMETFQFCVFAEYLSHLTDCVREERHRISFLGTARSLDNVHKSLKKSGCFDSHFAMPMPSRKQKVEIFERLAGAKRIHVGPDVLSHLEENCDGLDVLDVEALVELAMHRGLQNLTERHGGPGRHAGLAISGGQMESILKSYVPSKARGTSQISDGDDSVKSWDNIVGMTKAKAQLEDLLSFSSKYKDLIDKCPLRLRTGALLYGPPGCGKTFLVRCAAKICNLRIISVKGPELLNKYIGASEAGVRELFEKASGASPCMLFFDEFDAIAPKRGHDSTGVTDRVVNQFLTELDGIESLVGVFVLAATSRPDLVDAALLRPGRLDVRIKLDFPSHQERFEILSQGMSGVSEHVLADIASKTAGYSGADLMGMLGEAELMAVQRQIEDDDSLVASKPSVSDQELQDALFSSRPSVSAPERQRLEGIYSVFEHGGDQGGGTKRVTHA
ncbi:peroxisome biogenesis factor 1 [Chloropicon primus]|uniref:Peroxisome biogenesis factor 1 n=2 Tax=Chloropicon primus TaxID=1764295 RepID=A0A5B8MQY4_9CHLO|nr:peroxisome biogenesis factor 1 [Chloropicon primus]UPR01995.1 peroxisome biogenesis factor 1 [Chloropicon primus]|eukprot:QDZ22771.1 peroxisome biogenesis factor 1 [Chloropicon primus]